MLRGIRTAFRLLGIARTLARHDALAPLRDLGIAPGVAWAASRLSRRSVPGRPGQKLAAALTELGPTFIKLGQFLSTRADLLGEQVAADLAELQDRLPPFSSVEARATIAAELDREIDDLFVRFDDEPVSAASIAQVHAAAVRLSDDEDGEDAVRGVAVKVLRPGVEQAMGRDIELFLSLAELAESTQPRLRRFKPVQAMRVFEETVRLEMDLRMEAAAASELADNFTDEPHYRVPAVDWARSSRRVLTMEWSSGIPMDDRDGLLAAGHDLERVLTDAAAVFFKQVFRDGFFHGDQHPGNMFVREDGAIGVVDFGIMGRLSDKTRRYLADMLLATLARDYRRLAQVHADAGYLAPGQDVDIFAQALRSVCEPIVGRALEEISFARLLGQLLNLTETFSMPVQPQLLLLQKNMLMAEGISRRLVPGLNIWVLARPLIEDWMRETRGPEARLREGAEATARVLERLPRGLENLDRVLESLTEGTEPRPDGVRSPAGRDRAAAWHTRALWAGLAALGLLLLLD